MRKGKSIHTEESKNKIIQSNKTRIVSEETKLKMSLAAKERIKKLGSNLTNYNKNKQ